MNDANEAYADAGVDITAGYKAVELIKAHAAGTSREGVLSGIGGFGAAFSLAAVKGMAEPVMISGTDGVGTKLKIAFLMNRHDTVGVDCVAMCVNDIVCSGAEPLFFLDYIACGRNDPEKTGSIVEGVAKGCVMAGAALIGGETAEHPGLMPEDEYDLAGFAAGIVDRKNIIDGRDIREGDVLLGIASSGLHSNGFSLVRKVLDISAEKLRAPFSEDSGITLGELLLTPTRIYAKAVLGLAGKVKVKGLANITGGGLIENIPRMMPDNAGLAPLIYTAKMPKVPVFELIARTGGISRDGMYNTFNMGVGMAVCVAPEDAAETAAILDGLGEKAFEIGKVIKGGGLCLE